ncbi:MAG: hypothetical protein R3D44_14340 [Hyphomicrobiaceae bacterium]
MVVSPLFDQPDLGRVLDGFTPAQLDEIPIGVIGLAADGRVRAFNKAEAEGSGYGMRPSLGLDFFGEVAPCMNNPLFKGRIERAISAGTLDIVFNYVGDFDDAERELRFRVVSASDGGLWILTDRSTGRSPESARTAS